MDNNDNRRLEDKFIFSVYFDCRNLSAHSAMQHSEDLSKSTKRIFGDDAIVIIMPSDYTKFEMVYHPGMKHSDDFIKKLNKLIDRKVSGKEMSQETINEIRSLIREAKMEELEEND